MVPEPFPDLETFKVYVVPPLRLKATPTEVLEFKVMVQVVLVPEQDPDQPEKVEPVAGVAVKVILVPEVNLILQVLPQLIPEGELLIVPEPVPDLEIVTVLVVVPEEGLGVAVGVGVGVGVGVITGVSVGVGSGVSDGVIVGIVKPLLPG
jgi:hypothetical protein